MLGSNDVAVPQNVLRLPSILSVTLMPVPILCFCLCCCCELLIVGALLLSLLLGFIDILPLPPHMSFNQLTTAQSSWFSVMSVCDGIGLLVASFVASSDSAILSAADTPRIGCRVKNFAVSVSWMPPVSGAQKRQTPWESIAGPMQCPTFPLFSHPPRDPPLWT